MTEKVYFYRGHRIERVVWHWSNGREYRAYIVEPIDKALLRDGRTCDIKACYRAEYETLSKAKLAIRFYA